MNDKSEVNNKRDNSIILGILSEEKKILQEQISQCKAQIQMNEVGKKEISDIEFNGIRKIYNHLLQQKEELEKEMMKYDVNLLDTSLRDKEKERIVKMLVKNYSDTM